MDKLLLFLSVVLAVLKLAGVITWSWWLVAAPFLLSVGLFLLFAIVLALAADSLGRGLRL